LACDFFVTVTATFRLVYVFLVLDIGTRRIVHWNVTEHPTEWTVQQFRACVIGDEPYRFIVHDRDAIYSPAVDRALTSMHLRVLKTPARVPQANACCERLIGTARRECLDFVIPLNERHVQRVRPSGYLITTAVAHTPVLAPEFPNDRRSWQHDQPVTSFRARIVLPRVRFLAVSITSIGLSQSRREFLRSTGETNVLDWTTHREVVEALPVARGDPQHVVNGIVSLTASIDAKAPLIGLCPRSPRQT